MKLQFFDRTLRQAPRFFRESPWGGRLRVLLLFLVAFSPAIVVGWQIRENAVNTPMWDDWERGVLLRHYYEGTLDFQFLASPHIDHRILWPRLVILGLNELTGGDLRAEMAFTYVGHLLFALALFSLIYGALRPSKWVWGTVFLINLWLFHPMQYQNFLWGIQIAFMQPLMALGLCAWVMTRRFGIWLKFGLCTVFALLGTFSFSHGLFIWPVVFGLGLLLHDFAPTLKKRWTFLAAWVATTAAVASFYLFWKYENTSHPSHAYWTSAGDTPPALRLLDQSLERLGNTGELFFTLIGNYYGRLTLISTNELAAWFGGVVFVLFLVACTLLLWNWRRTELRDHLLPWAAMGGFAVVACLAMAIGRAWLGMKAGMIPRYGSISLLLTVAVIAMLAILLHRWRYQRGLSEPKSRGRSNLCAGLAVATAILQVPLWIYGVRQMENFKLARLQGRTSLLYINHFPADNLAHIDAVEGFARMQANYLNSHGLLDPPLFEQPDFGLYKLKGPLSNSRAGFLSAQLDPDGHIEIQGFATLPGQGRIADGVLLALFTGEGDLEDKETNRDPDNWQVLALGHMTCVPRTMPERMDYQFTNWSITYGKEIQASWIELLDPAVLPQTEPDRPVTIHGWVLDSERMEARRINEPLVWRSPTAQGHEPPSGKPRPPLEGEASVVHP
jgi:hypothetical protein